MCGAGELSMSQVHLNIAIQREIVVIKCRVICGNKYESLQNSHMSFDLSSPSPAVPVFLVGRAAKQK